MPSPSPLHSRSRVTAVTHFAAATLLTAVALLLSSSNLLASDSGRPNIVLIMVDDMGYHDLGCYGQRKIKTPHIDKMSSEGMRFTNVYAGSPVCAPARSVLMTGRHTGHTTVRGNFGKFGVKGLGGGNGRVPLNADDVTVAEVLQGAGYTTGMIGKWGLGEPNTTGEPRKQGFDYFFGHLNQRRAHTYYPSYLWRNEKKIVLTGNTSGKRSQHSHFLFAAEALEFVKKNADVEKPFFLYLPFTFPHSKYEIPSVAPYENEPWSKDAKVHAAMITQMDKDVGKLLTLLKELKIDDNTLVFFCSDNGAAQRWTDIFDSSHPLRGRKRDVYEGGIRTPMIARWPGRVPAATTNDSPWAFWDILPTLAEVAGNPKDVPNDIDGTSVLRSLLGQTQTELNNRFLYWEFYEGGFVQAVRRGKWKAIRFANKQLQLYDLSKDIAEATDVADENPEVVAQFSKYLLTARVPSKNWVSPVD
jgi:arylsulfatase A-like enzyme